jgi:hypothetical protein
MEEHFVLVHCGYEGIEDIIAIGDKDFVFDKYTEYVEGINNFQAINKSLLDYKNSNLTMEEIDKMYEEQWHTDLCDNVYYNKEVKRLCIMGYDNDVIKCRCKDFGIKLDEPWFY